MERAIHQDTLFLQLKNTKQKSKLTNGNIKRINGLSICKFVLQTLVLKMNCLGLYTTNYNAQVMSHNNDTQIWWSLLRAVYGRADKIVAGSFLVLCFQQ